MIRCLRIVKVGGSLFDLPDLGARLHRWLSASPARFNVLIAGGGPLADAIREADRRHHLGEEPSHWLCVRALHATAGWLAHLSDSKEVEDWSQLCKLAATPCSSGTYCETTLVFNPSRFLHEIEPSLPGQVLPHTWSATTDSIAARVAELLSAEELVLLKSAPPPTGDWQALAARGYVDADFPDRAARLPRVWAVDLRRTKSDCPAEVA